MIGLDLNVSSPLDESDLRALATGLFMLHREAATKWPNGYRQSFKRAGNVFTVEMIALSASASVEAA